LWIGNDYRNQFSGKDHIMRQALSFILLTLALPLLANAAEPAEQSAEAKVLARWLGTWNVDAVWKPAKWSPDGLILKETKVVERTLNGHFLQERITNDKWTGRIIYHFNKAKKAYQFWYFNSNGDTSEWIGTWDEKATTMTWTSDLGNGVEATMVTRFVDEDKYEFNIVAKNKAGEMFLDIRADHTRVKK
jgi:hypothetical protein